MAPIEFGNGEVHAAEWGAAKDGGFSDRDIERLEEVRAPLARVAEVYALRRLDGNLSEDNRRWKVQTIAKFSWSRPDPGAAGDHVCSGVSLTWRSQNREMCEIA